MDNLKAVQEYVDKMKATSSTLIKEDILREYNMLNGCDEDRNRFVQGCVLYTLDPYRMYGVTSKQVKKVMNDSKGNEIPIQPYQYLFGLLDDLADRRITGHEAVYHIADYVERHSEYADLIYGILDKDIETRANATLVNKVWGKGFIPVFDVALAKPYDDAKVDFGDGWYASRKLDGLRCICKVDGKGNARFFSRKGKEFFTLDVLKESIRKARISNVVFDGELCIMNGDKDDFKAISKEYNKKNHTIKNPKYWVFDILTHDEFNNGLSARTLSRRLYKASEWFTAVDNIEALEQTRVQDDQEVAMALVVAESQGHEGVILRKDCGYRGKRSSDILKVKKFHDAEYEVLWIETGNMRFIEDGQDIERETMTAVGIEHKGNKVTVGSGWSKEERARYYVQPELILGKVITVKYKQELFDDEGNVTSLQFPTLKAIHGAERTV